jgi:hypothetical protein
LYQNILMFILLLKFRADPHPRPPELSGRRTPPAFCSLTIPAHSVTAMDLSHNHFENFVGFPGCPHLRELSLDWNPIRSSEGSPQFPSLRW